MMEIEITGQNNNKTDKSLKNEHKTVLEIKFVLVHPSSQAPGLGDGDEVLSQAPGLRSGSEVLSQAPGLRSPLRI